MAYDVVLLVGYVYGNGNCNRFAETVGVGNCSITCQTAVLNLNLSVVAQLVHTNKSIKVNFGLFGVGKGAWNKSGKR